MRGDPPRRQFYTKGRKKGETGKKMLNLRNSETQHHRANLRQLTSKLPGTPTRAELSVSEGRLNLNPSTTNASVGAIAPTEGSSL